MPSQIDPTVPVAGNPTTQSVRTNFATAAGEISALQIAATGAPFLPLAGATMQGPVVLYNDPTQPMHPVTLGYFNANAGGGGSGGGPGGITDAPADGTLYGRQNGAWLHAVGTAELNAAPFLKLSGGVLTGALTLSGPPTAALQAATKGYVDAGFVPLSGATMQGPLILAGDPTVPLGAATKQSIDNQHFIPQIGPSSLAIAVVDNTTGADRTPTLTGQVVPYNTSSSGLKIQATRLSAPNAQGANCDGPGIQLFGSGATTPYMIGIYAGSTALGYKGWSFNANGTLTCPGNLFLASAQAASSLVMLANGPSFYAADLNNLLVANVAGGNLAQINLYANTTLANGTMNVQGPLNVAGTTTISGPLLSVQALSVAPGQTTNLGGALNVSGTTTISAPLAVGGTTSISAVLNVSGQLNVTGGSAVISSMYGITNSNSYLAANGSTGGFVLFGGGNGASFATRPAQDPVYLWTNNVGYIMTLDTAGHLVCNTLTQTSDRSLKTDIEDAPQGIEVVRKLSPKTFARIDGDGTRELGFIAQDIEDVLPEAIATVVLNDADETALGIRLTPLLAVLVNTAKQIDERLSALEGKRRG